MVVSTGPENKQVSVPDLIGSTEKEAAKALKDVGLALGNVKKEASDIYPAGQITYQSNSKNQLVDPGTRIDVIVSSGPSGGGNEPSGEVNYIGSVYIDVNPFDYLEIEEDEVEVVLEMEQDGWVTPITNEMRSKSEFPFTVVGIEGESDSPGIITMYVNGVVFKLPGEQEAKTWIANFKAVEE